VKGIVNRLEIRPTASPRDIRREIVRALHRAADLHAHAIDVEVTGETIRLTGTVESWREREAAERAASHAAGVTVVDNRITVRPSDSYLSDADTDDIC
jgi:osmotically-inducible protein OsmY